MVILDLRRHFSLVHLAASRLRFFADGDAMSALVHNTRGPNFIKTSKNGTIYASARLQLRLILFLLRPTYFFVRL